MTLKNKNWLENETLRLYLSVDSQENIASALSVNVGTVNNIINELLNSDDTIELQRQIAVVAKKNGVDIKQIAANLRWKNKIKQSSLDDRIIEKLLDGLDMLFNKHKISPSTGANHLCSIIETMLRHDIDLYGLEEEIKSKNIELKRISDQIENRNNELEETKTRVEKKQAQLRVKEKDLEQFHEVGLMLKLYEHPEISSEYGKVARTMIDFKKLRYDPKVIVAKYEESESLTKTNEKIEAKLQEKQSSRVLYKKGG